MDADEMMMLEFILKPENWLCGFGALVVVLLMFGRQNKHDHADHDIAAARGYELPTGGDKGIGLSDALWMISILSVGPFFLAGWMLAAPVFYSGAAVMLCLLVLTTLRAWTNHNRKLERAGLANNGHSVGMAGLVVLVFVGLSLVGVVWMAARWIEWEMIERLLAVFG